MNNRQRIGAILHYQNYDRMPCVHFGFWDETLQKFEREGHIARQTRPDGSSYLDSNGTAQMLGFEFEWGASVGGGTNIRPGFEHKVIQTNPDGSKLVQNSVGVVSLHRDGVASIESEVSHTLVDRESWQSLFKPRLQFSPDRLPSIDGLRRDALNAVTDRPIGLSLGSLYGHIRDWMGVVGLSYLQADDPECFEDIINTNGELTYQVAKAWLSQGVAIDFGHFWEDICYKNGPLVHPDVFAELVGPHYRRITGLLREQGCDICSLDCDGCIDRLLPTWLENGVNVMFPIEVGTWEASIEPWRKQYGRAILGVGGMDKRVFAAGRSEIDIEIERLKRLADLGGYIPCPDHRIAPDAEWDNILHYCEAFKRAFGW